ncbi:MAG: helix-turn-helix transcriptional regulator [Myxococcales bacterium]|nr:helix-turn-helix transcriptional regulator [Myxococcales bacterium]
MKELNYTHTEHRQPLSPLKSYLGAHTDALVLYCSVLNLGFWILDRELQIVKIGGHLDDWLGIRADEALGAPASRYLRGAEDLVDPAGADADAPWRMSTMINSDRTALPVLEVRRRIPNEIVYAGTLQLFLSLQHSAIAPAKLLKPGPMPWNSGPPGMSTVDGPESGPALKRKLDQAGSHEELTPRQREILGLFLMGYATETIATRLFVSQSTVRNHLKNIERKFGVSSQAALRECFVDSRRTTEYYASAGL